MARRLWVAAVVLAILVVPVSGLAHFLGGKWEVPFLYICDETDYEHHTIDGASRWVQAMGIESPAPWPAFSCDQPHVRVRIINDERLGYAYGIPSPEGGPFTSGEIFYNDALLKGEDDDFKLMTATHELGHIYGLAHNCRFSIMNADCFWWDAITGHDKGDLNTLYE